MLNMSMRWELSTIRLLYSSSSVSRLFWWAHHFRPWYFYLSASPASSPLLPSPLLTSPPLLPSNRQERLTHSFQGSEAALMSSWQTEQSSKHSRDGVRPRRITLDWQRCEVMSACDEIIMWAHLPVCNVSMALAWLSIMELFHPHYFKWRGEVWK